MASSSLWLMHRRCGARGRKGRVTVRNGGGGACESTNKRGDGGDSKALASFSHHWLLVLLVCLGIGKTPHVTPSAL